MTGSDKHFIGPFVRLHQADNVVVARTDVEAGTNVEGASYVVRDRVPAGHKMATVALRKGEPILKYNTVIGFAACNVPPGTMLHSHNIELREYERDYACGSEYRPLELIPAAERATFQGFARANGRVGTRNCIVVVSSVNCSATVVHRIAEWFTPERLTEYPNVDGVIPFATLLGCGIEVTGEPMDLMERTLAGYIHHPNAAAAVMVGLGCESCQIDQMLLHQKLQAGEHLRTLVMQEVGGTRKTIEAGIAAVREMLPEANRARRTPVSVEHLTVALQCGGSDAFSSITANPAVGAATDILTRQGGTAILSETPEIYGVEHTLTRRAATREIGEKLVERMRWWREEYAPPGREIQINGRVCPGNSAGGLANIVEKALGAAMKAGTGPLMEVYRFAERVTARGLVFMDTPGYDPCGSTGQIAGGANLMVFTTGRGSCFGARLVPSLKLATNTPMFSSMEEDMDMNCGDILEGACSIERKGEAIFEALLRTASGAHTKSEELRIGDYEFMPWQIGPIG